MKNQLNSLLTNDKSSENQETKFCENINQNENQMISPDSSQNLNLAIEILPQRKNNSRRKLNTNFSASRIIRSFKLILAFALVLILILNSHVILFFHIKIEYTIEKQDMAIFLNSSIKAVKTSREMSLREILDMSSCAPNSEWYQFFMKKIWIYIDMCIIFLIPFVTMTFSFVFVFFKVKITNENYGALRLDNKQTLNRSIYDHKILKNKRIVIKLFIINIYFLITILPYYVFLFFYEKNEFSFLKDFVMSLFYSNSALNFIFYGFTCRWFR